MKITSKDLRRIIKEEFEAVMGEQEKQAYFPSYDAAKAAIKKGELELDEKFIISENAWRLSTAGYSSMFIMIGDEVSVENL